MPSEEIAFDASSRDGSYTLRIKGEPVQLSKTVYFRDYLPQSKNRSGLTIPFSEPDTDLFKSVEHLSSHRLRQILGFDSFEDLERAAQEAQSPIASFARRLIEENIGRNSSRNRVDRQLQATFRGGKGSPLHEWYPYLEGYSPEFVNSIIAEFAPGATSILDPFCGSGTTALVAALRGQRGLYAEVNPVCQFIIEAKARALRFTKQERARVAADLNEFSDGLPILLRKTQPNEGLRRSFNTAFGHRPFFDASSYETILRLRTIVDQLEANNPVLAQFAIVAVLRSLVPGSLLIRRGDLRFRTENELHNNPPNFADQLFESLQIVSSDLLDAPTARGTIDRVCGDARVLSASISQPVDAIITSPPYLNGTNYFRNTKIELWFLRHLSSKLQLRSYRDSAITAGINDVTVEKSRQRAGFVVPSLVDRIVTELHSNTYDPRIPLMVQSYFQELNDVVEQMRKVSHDNSCVAIDLGDSCYGSVWVPTDQILAELMNRVGFQQLEKVTLRERQSRDGRKLVQTLQVFRISKRRKYEPVRALKAEASVDAATRWSTFRDNLPHQRGDMAKRNWGHAWHSLCSYQGKLKPSIAHTLARTLLPSKSGRVLDPFSGVGTIPFEARLLGHTTFAFDISPAAVAISRAKLEPLTEDKVNQVLKALFAWIERHRKDDIDTEALSSIRFNGPLPSYFHPRTLKEIVSAREFFLKRGIDDAAGALVLSATLHILHGNRPYALSRRSHPITPFAPTGPFEYRPLHERLTEKVRKCLSWLDSIPHGGGRAYFQDATAKWPEEVSQLDAIITSPPFFDSTRFHTANWMRLWFMGWNIEDFTERPRAFIDERQKRDFEVYAAVFAQACDRLKPSGYMVIHVGRSAKCDMAAALSGIAARYLTLVDAFSESVSHCESHGIRDKGTVTHHQYLLFQKI